VTDGESEGGDCDEGWTGLNSCNRYYAKKTL